MKKVSRKEFLASAAAGAITAPLWSLMPLVTPDKADGAPANHPICIFSKHLQWLGFEDVGKFVNDIGFDGVDLTVREGGHVPPEKAETLLPEAVEKITRQGVSVPMMATDINNADDPLTELVLRTASNHGIRYYRMAYYDYDDSMEIEENLRKLRPVTAKLAKLNEKYGLHGAYQNHAGTGVGASVWDIWYVIKDLDPRWTGMQFDIRHATVEGGNSWVNDYRLVRDFTHCSVVKDFIWEKNDKGRWHVKNVPMGTGMVDFNGYFALYKKWGIQGPISLHIEYPIFERDEHTLSKAEKMRFARKVLAKDLEKLRDIMQEEGII